MSDEDVAALRQLVEFLARGVVDRPEQVSVTGTVDAGAALLRIQVAAEDVGKVIGRQGRVIHAIRTVARAAAVRRGQRVTVEVLD